VVTVFDPFHRHTLTVIMTAFMARGHGNTLDHVHSGHGRVVIGATRGLADLRLAVDDAEESPPPPMFALAKTR